MEYFLGPLCMWLIFRVTLGVRKKWRPIGVPRHQRGPANPGPGLRLLALFATTVYEVWETGHVSSWGPWSKVEKPLDRMFSEFFTGLKIAHFSVDVPTVLRNWFQKVCEQATLRICEAVLLWLEAFITSVWKSSCKISFTSECAGLRASVAQWFPLWEPIHRTLAGFISQLCAQCQLPAHMHRGEGEGSSTEWVPLCQAGDLT